MSRKRLHRSKREKGRDSRSVQSPSTLQRHPVLEAQARYGNAATTRMIQSGHFAIQRSPDPDTDDPAVQHRLEQYLDDFMNIPITVQYREELDPQLKTKTVHVHPPYFINWKNLERYKKADANYEKAGADVRQVLKTAPPDSNRTAKDARRGKGSRHHIEAILQKAVEQNLVPISGNQPYPSAQDMRDWLVKYGIGVDCTMFVAGALNEVMADRGNTEDKLSGSGADFKIHRTKLARVETPTELRPGDVMLIPGHVRIVMSVKKSGDGVEFVTAESSPKEDHIGDDPSKPLVDDVGPRRREWRYPSPDKPFTEQSPQVRAGENWDDSGEAAEFGRYRPLAKEKDAKLTGAAPGGAVPLP